MERIMMCYHNEGLEEFLSDETSRCRDAIKKVIREHPDVKFDAVYNSAAKYAMSLLRNDSLRNLSIYAAGEEAPLESALRSLFKEMGEPSTFILPRKGIDRFLGWPEYTTRGGYELMMKLFRK